MGVSLQPQAGVLTVFREQTAPGTIATNDVNAVVFRTAEGGGFKLSKSPITSAEVRSDLQRRRDRHGMRSSSGTLPGELSLGSFDNLLQAVMRSTWSAVLTSPAFSLTYVAATGVLTRASGNFLTDGFRVGDTVTLAGAGANTAIPVMLTTVGSTTCTVGNRTALVDASSVAGVTMVRPKKLTLGTTRRLFTVEHWASTIADSQRFIDARVSSVTFTLERGRSVGISFTFTGLNLQTGTTQYFTSPTVFTSQQMAAPEAVGILQGGQLSTLQSCVITLDLNHSIPEVAGSTVGPDVVEGAAAVTGSATLYVSTQAPLTAFLGETEFMVGLLFRESGTSGFLSVALPGVTYGDYDTPQRIGQSDVQSITVPFMVGIPTGAGTDTSMLTLCTSTV